MQLLLNFRLLSVRFQRGKRVVKSSVFIYGCVNFVNFSVLVFSIGCPNHAPSLQLGNSPFYYLSSQCLTDRTHCRQWLKCFVLLLFQPICGCLLTSQTTAIQQLYCMPNMLLSSFTTSWNWDFTLPLGFSIAQ